MIITDFLQSTVALFALIDKPIPTTRRVHRFRSILQTVMQTPVERQRQLIYTTATPVLQRPSRHGRRHDALLVLALALPVLVVLHVEAVAHLVGQRPRLDSDVVRVDDDHGSGIVAGAHSTELRLTDHVIGEVDPGQQLGVVVRVASQQLLPAVLEEIVQRIVGPFRHLDVIVLVPDHHSGQGDEDVQLVEDHIDMIHNISAVTVHGPDVRLKVPVERVVHDQDQFYEL